ncbi:RelA/SpoT domain-containing protein [Enteractinococcus coprophilus]|uniref:RelA/SpoT domain-containing protein n=1 Tax=Enteractinococcus coprophilus TaxID=1027633 RepID=UPI00366772FB
MDKLPSKSAVRKAGSAIRQVMRKSEAATIEITSEKDPAELETDKDILQRAISVIDLYRSHFSKPMGRVEQTLRDICVGTDFDTQITSRLKRLPTIINKLRRPDNTDLSRMEDIGGCRVVVETYDELNVLHELVRREYANRVHRERDYVATPRDSGYRSVHLIVKEPSSDLKIEIQLRTRLMHDWADLVESFSRIMSEDFKQSGSHIVQEFMKLQSTFSAWQEGLGPELTLDEMKELRILGMRVQELLGSMTGEPERK